MWRGAWPKSSPRNSDIPSSSSSPSPSPCSSPSSFRCSSFKDIETLCLDSSDFLPTPTSTTSSNHHHQFHQPPSTPRRSIFHRVRTANSLLRHWAPSQPQPQYDSDSTRIVVYYTSLRVVRSTFDACRAVLSILHAFRLSIDERDVSMDASFMSDLRHRLRLNSHHHLSLPRVFIAGRYVGGADEILRLHEIGHLKSLVQGISLASPGTCATCGGFRFVLCHECSGSHKVFSDKQLGFRSCSSCNENGLVRCPRCCSPSPARHRNGS